MRQKGFLIPWPPFLSRGTHLPTEGGNPPVTILDEMHSEAIRGIDVIKQHGIDITVWNGAIYDYRGKVEVRGREVGNRLACRRENHPRDTFISHQMEVDRFLLRIFIRVAQEDAEPLLIGGIFDRPAN